MEKMIFVNIPVTDLAQSKAFYEAVGFTNDGRFTDDTAAAMQWSDTIVVMILTHDKWRTFTDKAIPDLKSVAQAAFCVSMDSREAVDAITEAAAKAGGTADPSPPQDYGFMYGRTFEDPDGHVWEPMWMDPKMATGEIEPPKAEVA